MELSDVDRRILTWLRALGSEPDYMHQTNIRSYDQAARKAAEVMNLAPAFIRDRLLAFEQEGFVEIVPRPGYSSIYFARITDDGKLALRQPARDANVGEPIIFVSCGQTTDEELALGAAIANIIDQETPARAYYAENQATLAGVSSHILDSLSRCAGFVGIMHHRGVVTTPDHTSYQRASVWIEQEIAIAAYRIHFLKQELPVRLYIQRGIKHEGLRDKIMLNPTTFDTNEEVVGHFRSIVKDRLGELVEADDRVATVGSSGILHVQSPGSTRVECRFRDLSATNQVESRVTHPWTHLRVPPPRACARECIRRPMRHA